MRGALRWISTLAITTALGLACVPASDSAIEAEPVASEPAPASGGAPRGPREAAPPPGRTSDVDVRAIVEQLGDEGSALVVLRPWHWPSLHDALASRLADPSPVAALAELPRDPSALPQLVAKVLELPPGSVTLAGWDPSRPVVVSLGEVPYDGPPGAVTPKLPVLDAWLPPVRHQAWVPATDPAAMIASLAAALGGAMTERPALVQGRAEARALASDGVAIVLLPLDAAVRAVVFHGAVGLDEARWLEHIRGRLDVPARAAVASPALQLLARSDAVLSASLRPWRLRACDVVGGRARARSQRHRGRGAPSEADRARPP